MKLGDFGCVRIGYIARLEHFGGAGDFGQRGADEPAGAAFGDGDAAAGGAVGLDHLASLVDQYVGKQGVVHAFKSHADAGDRLRGNAFASAGKAEAFGRRCLDADLIDVQTGDVGDPLAHRRAVRTDLRLFGDDRAVDMVDERAAFADQFGRMREKEDRTRRLSSAGRTAGNARRCRPGRPRRARHR